MDDNFINSDERPNIFEYLASLNDEELMNNFYSDPSCCICTFRFLHPVAQGVIYKLLFIKSPVSEKTMLKWPEAKNDTFNDFFKMQFDKLERLHILRKTPKDEYVLDRIFADNLQLVMSTDHQLSLVKEKTSIEKKPITQEELNQSSKSKLQRIIFFMLNMLEYNDMSHFVINLLQDSNLVEKKHDGYVLTVDGFKFVLEDVNTQIHILLLNYVSF